MDRQSWLDELPADEREVIEAGVGLGAPAGTKQAVWGAVASKLPALTAAGTVVAKGVTVFSLLNPFAVGLGLGVVVVAGVGGYRHLAREPMRAARATTSVPREQRRAPNPSQPVAANPEAPASEPPVEPRGARRASVRPVESGAFNPPVVEPAQSPSVASFPADPPAAAPILESGVVVESRRVAAAKSLLRAGDARRVLGELDALDAAFPRGLLVQEREGLRIEALLSLGERARAHELARRFLARYPGSPHAPAVERALR